MPLLALDAKVLHLSEMILFDKEEPRRKWGQRWVRWWGPPATIYETNAFVINSSCFECLTISFHWWNDTQHTSLLIANWRTRRLRIQAEFVYEFITGPVALLTACPRVSKCWPSAKTVCSGSWHHLLSSLCDPSTLSTFPKMHLVSLKIAMVLILSERSIARPLVTTSIADEGENEHCENCKTRTRK